MARYGAKVPVGLTAPGLSRRFGFDGYTGIMQG